MGLVNVDDPLEAARELERCRELGLAGAMISVLPPPGRGYDHPMYAPLWAAAEDLQMPLSMHVATGRASLSVDADQQGVRRVSEAAFYLQDRFADPRAPLGLLQGAGFVSFQEDRVGIRVRDVVGVETLMFGSDYPHTESTFPRSREIATELLADVPADEQRLILRENAARLYGVDLEALGAVGE